MHMLRGTLYVYQGEEIGMTNVSFEKLEDYRDIETLNAYKELVGQKRKNKEEMRQAIYDRGRDNARTPVQWNNSENAAFTTGTLGLK
jgi:oligo-1,6-glucosidase